MHQPIIYIDSYFLVNFFIDLQVVKIAEVLLEQKRGMNYCIRTAVALSLIACIGLWLKFSVLFVVGITYLMIKRRKFLALVGASLLLSGGIYFLDGMYKFPLVLSSAVVSSFLIQLIRYIKTKNHTEKFMVSVDLAIKGQTFHFNALIDTGNRLYTYSKPVHILEQSVLPIEVIPSRYVSYQSIGKESGVLPVICADSMIVQMESHSIEILKPMIALTKTRLNRKGEYQMLLHSEIERSLYVSETQLKSRCS
ncbi:hypothetical protein P261_00875 [Lachnospiraceae bacterium TWA4]|nr:hypothetical protein P261_00875 [Lachnospiraceae bacterium TWA4]